MTYTYLDGARALKVSRAVPRLGDSPKPVLQPASFAVRYLPPRVSSGEARPGFTALDSLLEALFNLVPASVLAVVFGSLLGILGVKYGPAMRFVLVGIGGTIVLGRIGSINSFF